MKGPLYIVCLFAAAVIATDTIIPVNPHINAPAMPPQRIGNWECISKWCSEQMAEKFNYLFSTPATFPLGDLPADLLKVIVRQGLPLKDVLNLRAAYKEARFRLPLVAALDAETAADFEAAVDARLLRRQVTPEKEAKTRQELLSVLRDHPSLGKVRAVAREFYGEAVAAEIRTILHAIRTETTGQIEDRLNSKTMPKGIIAGAIFREIFDTAIIWNKSDLVAYLTSHDAYRSVVDFEMDLAANFADVKLQKLLVRLRKLENDQELPVQF